MRFRGRRLCSFHPKICVLADTSLVLLTFSLPVASHKAAAWLLMWKLGARRAASISGSCIPKILLKFACLVLTVQEATHQQNITILSQKPHKCWQQTTLCVCGDEHKCVINPFMNPVFHLGRRLTFCSFSSVCTLFIIVSILAEAVQNEDVDGWFLFGKSEISV